MKGSIFAQNRGVSRTVVERQDETDCTVQGDSGAGDASTDGLVLAHTLLPCIGALTVII
jgi:hypothetical protein